MINCSREMILLLAHPSAYHKSISDYDKNSTMNCSNTSVHYWLIFVWQDGFFEGELIDGRRGLVPSNFIDRVSGKYKSIMKSLCSLITIFRLQIVPLRGFLSKYHSMWCVPYCLHIAYNVKQTRWLHMITRYQKSFEWAAFDNFTLELYHRIKMCSTYQMLAVCVFRRRLGRLPHGCGSGRSRQHRQQQQQQ